jgi:hypothetical protein
MNQLTVKDLIEHLQTLPPDLKCFIFNGESARLLPMETLPEEVEIDKMVSEEDVFQVEYIPHIYEGTCGVIERIHGVTMNGF